MKKPVDNSHTVLGIYIYRYREQRHLEILSSYLIILEDVVNETKNPSSNLANIFSKTNRFFSIFFVLLMVLEKTIFESFKVKPNNFTLT